MLLKDESAFYTFFQAKINLEFSSFHDAFFGTLCHVTTSLKKHLSLSSYGILRTFSENGNFSDQFPPWIHCILCHVGGSIHVSLQSLSVLFVMWFSYLILLYSIMPFNYYCLLCIFFY